MAKRLPVSPNQRPTIGIDAEKPPIAAKPSLTDLMDSLKPHPAAEPDLAVQPQPQPQETPIPDEPTAPIAEEYTLGELAAMRAAQNPAGGGDYVSVDQIFSEDISQIPEGMFSDEPPPGFAPMENPSVGMDAQSHPYQPEPVVEVAPNLKRWGDAQFPRGPGQVAPGQNVASSGPKPLYEPAAVEAARASLREDAARAKIAARIRGQAPPPAEDTPVRPLPNRSGAVRSALGAAPTDADGTYTSRIAIGTAYRFDGQLRSAPEWVDRNWLSYDQGPALAIPDVGSLKQGQWLVVQNVMEDDGVVAWQELKIYDDHTFRNLFMPVRKAAAA